MITSMANDFDEEFEHISLDELKEIEENIVCNTDDAPPQIESEGHDANELTSSASHNIVDVSDSSSITSTDDNIADNITENITDNTETMSESESVQKIADTSLDIIGQDEIDGALRSDNDVISISSSSSESEEEELEAYDMEDCGDIYLPYRTVYEEKDELTEYFLPGIAVRIKIIDRIYQPASHRLNPYLYIIEILHGKFRWTIQRRYRHFRQLLTDLEVFRAGVVMHHPTQITKFGKVPKFPHRPEIMILSEKSRENLAKRLQKFLQGVVNHDRLRNSKYTLNFLEVSHLSFVNEIGRKLKEGEVVKKAGGHTFPKSIFRSMKMQWHKRWLIVKDNFVLYIDKELNKIRDVLLFDTSFTVSCDTSKIGFSHGLIITNGARNLMVQCPSGRQSREWMNVIVNTMAGPGGDWIREHRYNSFAPMRKSNGCKWYIDGADYFSEVADALNMAKEEVFITDWWLSPELLLKRPAFSSEDQNRLDYILKKIASRGVRIFVLLYKELELALTINSNYSKRVLSLLHKKNVQVIRHPDHVASDNATVLWSHHEKIVCIDQKICFLGGFDLCYGRWDDNTHRLKDFGSARRQIFDRTDRALVSLSTLVVAEDAINSVYHKEQMNNMQEGEVKMFIGKDYGNPYFKDIIEVEKPFADYIDRNVVPRMPWHDIGCLVVGDIARDVARHFIQRWNFTKHEKAKELDHVPFLLPRVTPLNPDDLELFDNLSRCNVQVIRSASSWAIGGELTDSSIYACYIENIKKAKHFIYIENQFFITSLSGHAVTNEIGDAIVDRILTALNNDENFKVYIVMPLLPCFPGEIGTASATSTCFIEFWNLQSIRRMFKRLNNCGIEDPGDYISVCGLRNYADWTSKMVTEIIYVHSKLMIIDDCTAIIGSANINDRSMNGSRDSEIAVCVQDHTMVPGVMNSKTCQVGMFCSSLRRKLFQEHLGLLNEPCANVVDPISNRFFKDIWRARAKQNAEIYEEVFKCLPSNNVKTFADIKPFTESSLNKSSPAEARSKLKEIRGFIVEKPIEFLENQNLWPAAGTNESLVPTKVYT